MQPSCSEFARTDKPGKLLHAGKRGAGGDRAANTHDEPVVIAPACGKLATHLSLKHCFAAILKHAHSVKVAQHDVSAGSAFHNILNVDFKALFLPPMKARTAPAGFNQIPLPGWIAAKNNKCSGSLRREWLGSGVAAAAD